MKIAVILGGWSSEREVSLRSGKSVSDGLDGQKYEVVTYDPAKELNALIADATKIDLAFIMLHGKFGEDGRIQGLLDILKVPYVGSGVLASAMAVNKKITKNIYRNAGLPVAQDIVLSRESNLPPQSILDSLGPDVVVKPLEEGSSVGMSVCRGEVELSKGMKKAFGFGNEILVEEYIKGREVSCCVLGNQEAETLPIIEITPKRRYRFFDYEAKYKKGAANEICPAALEIEKEEYVRDFSVQAHKALGCMVWSRTDMIIRDEKIYLLETNTIPGMTENSLFPLAAKAAGMDFSTLLERLIALSLDKPKDNI